MTLIRTVRRKCIICQKPVRVQSDDPRRWCDEEACILAVADRAAAEAAERTFKIRKAKFAETDPYHITKLENRCQDAFNAMIRELDRDMPCISCGRYDIEIPMPPNGHKWDAGHHKTRAAFPEHRYNALNTFRQCASCNSGSYHHALKFETVSDGFKDGIAHMYQPAIMEFLKIRRKPPIKWTCPELTEMTKAFRAETKLLKSGQPPSRDWRSLF